MSFFRTNNPKGQVYWRTTKTSTKTTAATTKTSTETTATTTKTTAATAETTTETIYKLICKNPKITAKEMAAVCGITAYGVTYQIKKLKTAGRITRVGGSRNGGEWKVN